MEQVASEKLKNIKTVIQLFLPYLEAAPIGHEIAKITSPLDIILSKKKTLSTKSLPSVPYP
jgi:hypothetical protein